ncbi:MAG: DUF4065 domain-containing protein [Lachnospiraceae bacterium]|jgi:uncharacterized phage-associated protein|nr:DUF4065 domain-containing protein [Lachnospiraceae bacterium]
MNLTKGYCEACSKEVIISFVDKKIKGEIKGKEYVYFGREAKCSECNHLLDSKYVEDFNNIRLEKAYREKNNLISWDLIKKLPKMYGIGKRPLSLLLGWGEQTYTRYYNGDIPTKNYSDTLLKLYNDPHAYLKLLEKNKDILPSEKTYTKSKTAVEKLIKNKPQNISKIDQIAEYLLIYCEDISVYTLQKLLYYVQGFYYAFNETFLFKEDCEAWSTGPVFPSIYNKYKDYSYIPFRKEEKDVDISSLSSCEKIVLASVIRSFACYSGIVLKRFTRSELPWLSTRGKLSQYNNSSRIIHKDKIAEYFKCVKEKYNMLTPNAIDHYSKSLFQQLKS